MFYNEAGYAGSIYLYRFVQEILWFAVICVQKYFVTRHVDPVLFHGISIRKQFHDMRELNIYAARPWRCQLFHTLHMREIHR